MLWKEVKEGYKFKDDSYITQIHEEHLQPCYSFTIRDHRVSSPTLTVSQDHIFLCDISNMTHQAMECTFAVLPENIPTAMDVHFVCDTSSGKMIKEIDSPIEWDNTIVNKKLAWLPAYIVHDIEKCYGVNSIRFAYDLRLNNKSIDDIKLNTLKQEDLDKIRFRTRKIVECDYVGEKSCFCVSTNTSRYKICGVTHHNSVALRNIIFHSLTHSDDIKIGLVDLKLSEFTKYKGMNNVVGVANNVREACELLRLARECMYKRNLENSKNGLTDFADFKPSHPTENISLFGREFPENTELEVEISGEKKTMSVKEILDFVQNNYW